MRRKQNIIIRGIHRTVYIVSAVLAVLLIGAFAFFKPFNCNPYWVYCCGLAAGWFARYAIKK